MDMEVTWFDAKILKHLVKVEQLKQKLCNACFVDYLPALVPIVQTYLRQTLEKSEAASEEPIEEQESDNGSSGSESDHPPKEDEKEGDSDDPVMQDAGDSSDMPELQHDYEDHTEDGYCESSSGTLEEEVKHCMRALINVTSENNCFLNVTIQTLWHLRRFRREFMSTKNFANNSVVTELHNVFLDLAKSVEEPVNPSRLREALSKMDAEKFLEGKMGDPIEALEAILKCLHQSLTSSSSSNTKSGDQDGTSKCTCIAHRLFVTDQSFCFDYTCTDWVHYMGTPALRQMKKKYADRCIGEFQKEADEGERVCEGCNKQIDCCQQFSTVSQVVTCSLPHDEIVELNAKILATHRARIRETFESIPTEVYFSSCEGIVEKSKYHLVAIVCFFSGHYICFTRNPCGNWVMYNDLTSNEIGGWDGVFDFCKESDFLPVTLFFEVDNQNMSLIEPFKAAESPRLVNSGDKLEQGETKFSVRDQDPSQSAPNLGKTIWIAGLTHTSTTNDDNVHQPSKMPVEADFYCSEHGIVKSRIPLMSDRISLLHDHILHEILSHIKTRLAVRTMLLSKRWKGLWASMPFLFDNYEQWPPDDEKISKLVRIVSHVLQLYDATDIHTFRLWWYDNFNHEHLDGRVDHVIRRNVKFLELHVVSTFPGKHNEVVQLPSCIFTCPSIEKLRLVIFDPHVNSVPEIISLGRLKELYIANMNFDHDQLKRLVGECPFLEELEMLSCLLTYPDISPRLLRKLIIIDSSFDGTVVQMSGAKLHSISFICNDIDRLSVSLWKMSFDL